MNVPIAEPFSIASWMITAFVAVQLSAAMIFLFEWLSPAGYNMKWTPAPDHKFSLFRTYWLVWAVLFQASVQVTLRKSTMQCQCFYFIFIRWTVPGV